MGSVGLVARRPWRHYAGPALFLLVVTLAVVLLHGGGHGTPKLSPVVASHRTGPSSYRVVRGDTLAGIAAKTGVSLAHLRALNPNVHPSLLFIGEELRLR